MAATETAQDEMSVKQRAQTLGIKYLLPVMTSLTTDNKGVLIPVRVCDNLMKNGYECFAAGHYKLPLNMESPNMIPDPKTFTQLSWKPEIAWMQCDTYCLETPSGQCPRLKLKELQQKAKDMGFIMKAGLEPEFTILKKDEHKVLDRSGSADLLIYQDTHETLRRYDFIDEIFTTMSDLGWGPYEFEHEGSRGQYEVNYNFSDALTAADRHSFFKFMAKELAVKHGFRATFMPLPSAELTLGNGLHLNVSLWDVEKDVNLFPDAKTETGLSSLAQHFMAGILTHAESLTAILCPHPNSYKRLHGCMYAQIIGTPTISWGVGNRFAMIRVLPNMERIEIRCSDSSTNPYLALSSILAAGLHGIKDKIALDKECRLQEDLFLNKNPPILSKLKTLPKTLQEAMMHLSQDEKLKEYLGEELVDGFLFVKTMQLEEELKIVTPSEIALVDEY